MNLKLKAAKVILKNWLIKKPAALQAGEWEDWHTKTKIDHPYKYWLQETVTSAVSTWWTVRVAWPLRDFYWGGMHRYHPKHKYAICKPRTLKPGYHDCEERILHCVMEEVTQFYETGCNYTAWRESSDAHAHAYNEIDRVYWWWKDCWPHREDRSIWGEIIPEYPELPKKWGFLAAINEKHRNTPEVKEWRRIANLRNHNESDWDDMEAEMLNRIVNIRQFMWH